MNSQSTDQDTQPETRRYGRHSGGWVGGTILIALGVIFLLQNYTGFHLYNWWALFILLPAVGAFSAAARNYQEAGRVTAGVRTSLFGGLVLVVVTATFLFSLNWTIIGPVLLLLAGAGLLINGVLPE